MHVPVDTIASYLAGESEGVKGEFLVYMDLIDVLTPRRILRNLLVATAPAQGGETAQDTEIDLLVLHTSGIYVLEIKDYGGWIFGRAREKHWTQVLPDGHGGSVKYPFYNPLRQNYCHTQALRQALGIFGGVPLHPIVVFSDRCEFKKLELKPADIVVRQRDLPGTVARIAGAHGHCLSAGDVEAIYDYLRPLSACPQGRIQEHIKTVEDKKRGNRFE